VPEVVAIGLGGPEEGFPPEPFAALFAEARRRGLRAAPHAGEAAGPASIRSALDALGAERIQHGVRAVEDLALLAEIVERRIALAVCPTSNLRLGVVPSLDAHPLRRLWDAGAIVSVNTDDPGFFASDLVWSTRSPAGCSASTGAATHAWPRTRWTAPSRPRP